MGDLNIFQSMVKIEVGKDKQPRVYDEIKDIKLVLDIHSYLDQDLILKTEKNTFDGLSEILILDDKMLLFQPRKRRDGPIHGIELAPKSLEIVYDDNPTKSYIVLKNIPEPEFPEDYCTEKVEAFTYRDKEGDMQVGEFISLDPGFHPVIIVPKLEADKQPSRKMLRDIMLEKLIKKIKLDHIPMYEK